MNTFCNSKLTRNSQKLRKEMTKEECHLWYDFLRDLPYNIKRQKVIGRYIVDFYCPVAKIIIELDGSQHFSTDGKSADSERDRFLTELGFTILRYPNIDIHHNFRGVCEDINRHITDNIHLTRKDTYDT